MVQPGQGLRVHNPRRRWRGPLRALLRYTGPRVQEPRGGREGHLRGGPGPEGSAGPKRLQGVSAKVRQRPTRPGSSFVASASFADNIVCGSDVGAVPPALLLTSKPRDRAPYTLSLGASASFLPDNITSGAG